MNRILFANNYPSGLKNAFNDSGWEVVEPTDESRYYECIETKINWITSNYKIMNINAIFSFDFDINIAKVCNMIDIMYISWTVDSPHISLYSEMAQYDTNRIVIFDHDEYVAFKEKGYKNVYYSPLATDVKSFRKAIISSMDGDKYKRDVSFMGNLYDDEKHALFDKIIYLPEYLRGYIEGMFEAQANLWGIDLFRTEVFDKIINELKEYVNIEFENTYMDSVYNAFFDQMLCMKTAQIERKMLCDKLCKRYDFVLYTGSDTSYNTQINNQGYIDYLNQMPIMFNSSKINININLHCISSGIPLRVLDIMACGGFCLTNYQDEIAQYFMDGVDLVMFSDFDDMIQKIEYYLKHEDERKKIAYNGCEKVSKLFDYEVVIPQILENINK